MEDRSSGSVATLTRPAGQTLVASFSTYREAEAAVDHLSDHGFPVQRVTIVGEGVRIVERVTGPMHYRRAALHGAIGGLVAGGLFGWLFGAFDWVDPLVSAVELALLGVAFGVVLGALAGVFLHAIVSGGRRDFQSVKAMEAERYDILADEEVAADARRLLEGWQPTAVVS
jgi:hypothetical protein